MLFPHFSDEHPQILNCISVLFNAMYEKDTGYELTVFGQFYHFFGLVFSNHYFIENPTRTRRDYKRILQLKQVLEFIEKNYAKIPDGSCAYGSRSGIDRSTSIA